MSDVTHQRPPQPLQFLASARHQVERGGEPAELVVTGHLDPRALVAVRHPLRRPGQRPQRPHHTGARDERDRHGGQEHREGHADDPHAVGAGEVEERGDLPVGRGGEEQRGRRHIGVELPASGGGEAGRHRAGVGGTAYVGGNPGQIVGQPHRRGMPVAEAVIDELGQLGESPGFRTRTPLEAISPATVPCVEDMAVDLDLRPPVRCPRHLDLLRGTGIAHAGRYPGRSRRKVVPFPAGQPEGSDRAGIDTVGGGAGARAGERGVHGQCVDRRRRLRRQRPRRTLAPGVRQRMTGLVGQRDASAGPFRQGAQRGSDAIPVGMGGRVPHERVVDSRVVGESLPPLASDGHRGEADDQPGRRDDRAQ